MATEPVMPDGRPMHEPCTCPECSDGPGIDYDRDRTDRVFKSLEMNRAERQRRLTAWRESCQYGS